MMLQKDSLTLAELSELPILVAEDDDTNFRLIEILPRPKKLVRAINGKVKVNGEYLDYKTQRSTQ